MEGQNDNITEYSKDFPYLSLFLHPRSSEDLKRFTLKGELIDDIMAYNEEGRKRLNSIFNSCRELIIDSSSKNPDNTQYIETEILEILLRIGYELGSENNIKVYLNPILNRLWETEAIQYGRTVDYLHMEEIVETILIKGSLLKKPKYIEHLYSLYPCEVSSYLFMYENYDSISN